MAGLAHHLVKYRPAARANNYFIWAKQFYDFIGDIDAQDITIQDVNERYLGYLRDSSSKGIGRPLKINTIAYRLKGARYFFEFIQEQEEPLAFGPDEIIDRRLIQENKEILNSSKTVPLKQSELEKLRRELASRINADSLTGLRDRLGVEVMVATGMTITELRRLTRDDFDVKNRRIRIRHYTGKNSYKNRSFNISGDDVIFTWLNRYLEMRTDKSDLLFVSYRTKSLNVNTAPIEARSIQRMVQHLREEAGLKSKITPESLRVTLMIRKVIENVGITEFRSYFGYSDSTSRAYYNLFPAVKAELGISSETHMEIKTAVAHYGLSLQRLYELWKSGRLDGMRLGDEQIWLLKQDLNRELGK